MTPGGVENGAIELVYMHHTNPLYASEIVSLALLEAILAQDSS